MTKAAICKFCSFIFSNEHNTYSDLKKAVFWFISS